jgi:hypothetical protein
MAHSSRTTIHAALLAVLSGSSVSLAQLGDPGPSGPAPMYAIFAPGTDPQYIARVNARLAAYNAAIGAIDDQTGPRWPGALGTPLTIRWSVVPDYTVVTPISGLLIGGWSTIFETLDNQFPGGYTGWNQQIVDAMDAWSNVCGASLIHTGFGGTFSDDGAPWGSPGLNGFRGDIRIAMARVDGPGGVLAFATGPNNGDVVLDVEDAPTFCTEYSPLAGVISHAIGIALGLKPQCIDSAVARSIMSPIMYGSSNFQPQSDDMRGAQRLYGDVLEINDSPAAATVLPTILSAMPILNLGGVPYAFPVSATAIASLLSLHSSTDEDWFRFTITKPVDMSVTITQREAPYSTAPIDPTTNLCGAFTPVDPVDPSDIVATLFQSDAQTPIATGHDGAPLAAQIPGLGDYYLRINTSSRDFFVRPYYLQLEGLTACRFLNPYTYAGACKGMPFAFEYPFISSGPSTFQWYKNDTLLPGQTTNTLSFASFAASDVGYYYCHASTPCGDRVGNVVVLASTGPEMSSYILPVRAQVPEGDWVTLNAESTGNATAYQWRLNGMDIPGATDSSYEINHVSTANVGAYDLRVTNACGSAISAPSNVSICYANCDRSVNAPILSVADFVCFLNRFRYEEDYANCDGSTTPPVLNAGDFVCFLQKFRAGCP